MSKKTMFKEFLKDLINKASRRSYDKDSEDPNGSYLRTGEPADRSELRQKLLKAYTDGGDPELTPGDPERCLGNGEQGYECCCDNCDHYLDCYPEYAWDSPRWNE